MRYQDFKDTANLILGYETEEDTKDRQEIIRERQWPTCQTKLGNKAQLTYHRKKSKKRLSEYWKEQKAPEEFQTCGEKYQTEKDLDKRRRFHCGDNKEEKGYGKKTGEGGSRQKNDGRLRDPTAGL